MKRIVTNMLDNSSLTPERLIEVMELLKDDCLQGHARDLRHRISIEDNPDDILAHAKWCLEQRASVDEMVFRALIREFNQPYCDLAPDL